MVMICFVCGIEPRTLLATRPSTVRRATASCDCVFFDLARDLLCYFLASGPVTHWLHKLLCSHLFCSSRVESEQELNVSEYTRRYTLASHNQLTSRIGRTKRFVCSSNGHVNSIHIELGPFSPRDPISSVISMYVSKCQLLPRPVVLLFSTPLAAMSTKTEFKTGLLVCPLERWTNRTNEGSSLWAEGQKIRPNWRAVSVRKKVATKGDEGVGGLQYSVA